MKLLRTINNDIKVYDCNIRDYFGGKAEVWYNEDWDHYRLMAKYKDYKKERKKLDSIKCQHVIVPEYLEVIDITHRTLKRLDGLFPGARHTQFQLWEQSLKEELKQYN